VLGTMLLGSGRRGAAGRGAGGGAVCSRSGSSPAAPARGGGGSYDLFPFSLEPARLAGPLWPNFYGDYFTHTGPGRDSPPRGKHTAIWVPSLYLGGLTLVLALGAWGLRSGPPWRGWLTAVAVLSLLASPGRYSSPLWWPAGSRRSPTSWDRMTPCSPPRCARTINLRDGDGASTGCWRPSCRLKQFRYPASC